MRFALLITTMLVVYWVLAAAEVAPRVDDSEKIAEIVRSATERQERERAERAEVRDAARTRRNANPKKAPAVPKKGDLNSMLAWAIENSDPEKLKDNADLAAQHVKSVNDRKQKFEEKLADAPEVLDKLFGTESNKMKKPIGLIVNATREGAEAVKHSEVENALAELENHVEDIDKANDVNVMGGLGPLVQLLSSSNELIALRTASVLGIMASNNIKAQQQILEAQALPILLQLLRQGSAQAKALYAVGNLVRNYPEAAEQLFKSGGPSLLLELLSSDVVQVKKRVLMLMSDLAAVEEVWHAWLFREVNSPQKDRFMKLLHIDDEDLHEKVMHLLLGLLRQPPEGKESEAEVIATDVAPHLEAYISRTKEDSGFDGRNLASTILQGREAIQKAAQSLLI